MTRTKTTTRALRPRGAAAQDGQDLVEFAIVLPVLLLLILGIIEFGVLVLDYNTISNAAREGARYGIVHPLTTDSGDCVSPGPNTIRGAACRLTAGLDLSRVGITSESLSGGSGLNPRIRVTAEYTTTLMTAPIIEAVGIPGTFTLTSTATMDREQ